MFLILYPGWFFREWRSRRGLWKRDRWSRVQISSPNIANGLCERCWGRREGALSPGLLIPNTNLLP